MRFRFLPGLFILTAVSAAAPRMDSHGMAAVAARMQELVNCDVIAGSVTLVAQHGKTVHLAAVGSADIAARRPMKADDLFWIASMTKPMTAACVMMLADQGKLSVDDPVEKFIPEFAALYNDRKNRD